MDAGQPGPVMWREEGDKRPSMAVHMPMQGMRAPTPWGNRAQASQLLCPRAWEPQVAEACSPGARARQPQSNSCSPQLDKLHTQQLRPNTEISKKDVQLHTGSDITRAKP